MNKGFFVNILQKTPSPSKIDVEALFLMEGKMHKTQVFIRDDQYKALQKLIGDTGKKQSTLIREGIDLFINKAKKQQLWKEKLLSLSGSLSSEEANEMIEDIQAARESWKNRY